MILNVGHKVNTVHNFKLKLSMNRIPWSSELNYLKPFRKVHKKRLMRKQRLAKKTAEARSRRHWDCVEVPVSRCLIRYQWGGGESSQWEHAPQWRRLAIGRRKVTLAVDLSLESQPLRDLPLVVNNLCQRRLDTAPLISEQDIITFGRASCLQNWSGLKKGCFVKLLKIPADSKLQYYKL